MTDTMLALVMMEAKAHVNPDAPIADRFRAAFKVARHHWMVTDENKQLMGACEAVYASATPDERLRIEAELRALRDLTALMNGVPVDIDRIAEGMDDVPGEPIRIMDLWREADSDQEAHDAHS